MAGSRWEQAAVQTHRHSASNTIHPNQFRLASAMPTLPWQILGETNQGAGSLWWRVRSGAGRAKIEFRCPANARKEIGSDCIPLFDRLKSNLHHKCVFIVGRRPGDSELPLRVGPGGPSRAIEWGGSRNRPAERFDTLKRRPHGLVRVRGDSGIRTLLSDFRSLIAVPPCLSMKPKSA